ncbi:10772_t:CDS:2 [Ambispora leptoticha]|uniref:10772_t:CDS:1 n=1 Tax=Ambispora leptoticha TaxID=144679 RepID=A0A9N9D9G9_9GLOM|nr:10772_t:CDS:2 [Ambispora leptoticha]
MGLLPTPTNATLRALAVSYLYPALLLGSVEIYQRITRTSVSLTRKIIHLGAGTYMLATLYLFEQWQWTVFLMGSFVVLNAIFWRMRIFKAMDTQQATPGTVYFAFSCAFLLGWFHQGWEDGFPRGREYIAIAGIMAMTYGDAFAAIIGKRYGKHEYQVIGDGDNRRTLEGSQANFIASFLAVSITWMIMSPPELNNYWDIIFGSIIAAVASTAFEAISPRGTDNLTVPIGVSFTLSWLGY